MDLHSYMSWVSESVSKMVYNSDIAQEVSICCKRLFVCGIHIHVMT
jgi:gamma-glutamyl:cysteine ligase YbdK (ATP-grasp superfamily)